MPIDGHAFRRVLETTRERELQRYASIPTNIKFNDDGPTSVPDKLETSEDPILTSLAQLTACRTGASRALLSIFDQDYQYVIAESSSTLRLGPSLDRDQLGEDLWLCGTALPRHHGVCEYALLYQDIEAFETNDDPLELPFIKVDDLTCDPRFCAKPYCQPGSPIRFYAAVPIRTNNGVNIGVLCVMHDEPLSAWDATHTQAMRDVSRTIMRYMETSRARNFYERSTKLVTGLGSFVDEKPVAPEPPLIKTPAVESEVPPPGANMAEDPTDDASCPPRGANSKESLFAKAAGILKQSTDLDSCVFFDPLPRSYGAMGTRSNDESTASGDFGTSGGSDDGQDTRDRSHKTYPCCEVLGSSEDTLSADPQNRSADSRIPHKFLTMLLKRYSRGKIFNFDKDGGLQSDDSWEEDTAQQSEERLAATTATAERQRHTSAKRHSLRRGRWTRRSEGEEIQRIFPGVRSVAFLPIWDPKRETWLAGGFVLANRPARLLITQQELTYFKAFGIVIAGEVLRQEVTSADKAKFTALSCLSHELRSPLHGIMLGLELLCETKLDPAQSDICRTFEVCSRTLQDTLDHLLDFAKINHFITDSKRQRKFADHRGLRSQSERTIEAGMMNIKSNIKLDSLLEEVMDSVLAGFHFHQSTLEGQSPQAPVTSGIADGRVQLSSIRDVSVYYLVTPGFSWDFFAEPGALRRIIMNLFGNALKFTSRGHITVSIEQSAPAHKHLKNERQIVIKVEDTGRGMAKDYLQTRLFHPFSKEDNLSPGTGLGLSLVKQIVSALGGRISVKSTVGRGTTITVKLLLEFQPSARDDMQSVTSPLRADPAFEQSVERLRGLRAQLVDLNKRHINTADTTVRNESDGTKTIRRICQEWLHLELVDESPDLNIFIGRARDVDALSLGNVPAIIACNDSIRSKRCSASVTAAMNRGSFALIHSPIRADILAKEMVTVLNCNNTEPTWPTAQGMPIRPAPSSLPSPPDSDMDSYPAPTADPVRPPPAPLPSPPNSDASSSPSSSSLVLPASPPSDGNEPPISSLSAHALNLPSLYEHTRPGGKPFLLVDDNNINLKILSAFMAKLKRGYHTACNGAEAVQAYQDNSEHIKCILMDISMPVMDGLEATRLVRAHERKNNVRPAFIIALTGLASRESQQEAFASGVDLFLTKPVQFKELNTIFESHNIMPSLNSKG